jgi:pimeloyl-ACP methyl ester carboxylesterase
MTAEPKRRRRGSQSALVLAVALVGSFLGGWALRLVETGAVYPVPPPDTNLSHFEGELVSVADGAEQTAHAWYLRARGTKPTLATFHGNGDQLSALWGWLQMLRQRGLGAYLVEYPGYGVSDGQAIDERNVYHHAELLLNHLHEKLGVPRTRTILVGESLGTGVAVEMAARDPGRKASPIC